MEKDTYYNKIEDTKRYNYIWRL